MFVYPGKLLFHGFLVFKDNILRRKKMTQKYRDRAPLSLKMILPSNILVFGFSRTRLQIAYIVVFCIAYVIVLFKVLLAFALLQVKAADEAISKAEEQVEKFTEMAKETKVLFVLLVNFEWLC